MEPPISRNFPRLMISLEWIPGVRVSCRIFPRVLNLIQNQYKLSLLVQTSSPKRLECRPGRNSSVCMRSNLHGYFHAF